jgi:hypothetical protein
MIKKILRSSFIQSLWLTVKNYRILSHDLGQYKSMRSRECRDVNNNAIPWYTYPAIEYINQLDFSDKIIFEYGSGYSTLFWAKRCKEIVSVEDSREWFNRLKDKMPDNVEYLLKENESEYVRVINNYTAKYDIIIIDGNHRYECAIEALNRLKDTGFIILDNSDWKEKTSKLLRDSDLIEVDMSGFGPINGYTWTTSFYFKRNVSLIPAHNQQPVHGVGSLKYRESD